jgi:hypothetical protein
MPRAVAISSAGLSSYPAVESDPHGLWDVRHGDNVRESVWVAQFGTVPRTSRGSGEREVRRHGDNKAESEAAGSNRRAGGD